VFFIITKIKQKIVYDVIVILSPLLLSFVNDTTPFVVLSFTATKKQSHKLFNFIFTCYPLKFGLFTIHSQFFQCKKRKQ